GRTNTLPLHVEILYNEYAYSAAFAVATLLALSALVTLVLKTWLEWRHGESLSATHRHCGRTMNIEIQYLHKCFGPFSALFDINLEIRDSVLQTCLGPFCWCHNTPSLVSADAL